jgi:hypothetical protein
VLVLAFSDPLPLNRVESAAKTVIDQVYYC